MTKHALISYPDHGAMTKQYVICSKCDSDQLTELSSDTKGTKFACRSCGFLFYANVFGNINEGMAAAIKAGMNVGEGVAITPTPMPTKCSKTGCQNPKATNSSLCGVHKALKQAQQQAAAAKLQPASTLDVMRHVLGNRTAVESAEVVEAKPRMVIVPED